MLNKRQDSQKEYWEISGNFLEKSETHTHSFLGKLSPAFEKRTFINVQF